MYVCIFIKTLLVKCIKLSKNEAVRDIFCPIIYLFLHLKLTYNYYLGTVYSPSYSLPN